MFAVIATVSIGIIFGLLGLASLVAVRETISPRSMWYLIYPGQRNIQVGGFYQVISENLTLCYSITAVALDLSYMVLLLSKFSCPDWV